MNVNKKTIALVSALALVPNTYGMWSSITNYASAAKPVADKAWQKIKENKGYIGAAATAAGLVYGGIKAYQYYSAQPEIAQDAALLDDATRSAGITNVQPPVVAAELAPTEEVIKTLVEDQVGLQHSASANSLSSEADVVVPAPLTEDPATQCLDSSNHPLLIHGRDYRISSPNNVRLVKYLGQGHKDSEAPYNENPIDLNSSTDAETYYFKSLELDPQSQKYNTYAISAKGLKARVIRDITENQRRVRFDLPGDTAGKK